MGVITLNGITSTSIGLQVEVPPNYEIPERIYESVPVPGRNGDIVMDTGAYKNVPRVYDVSIGEINGNLPALLELVSGWLHSAPGYIRLEDSYEPGYFKLAKYSEECNFENILQQAGRATLTFDRKPQRFLKIGEDKVIVEAPMTIKNPTRQLSKPLIKVLGTGAGKITIGSYTVDITNIPTFMYIDSDIEDAYKDVLNLNNAVTVNNGFPMFKPGDNSVSFSGGITSLEITPRWWTI